MPEKKYTPHKESVLCAENQDRTGDPTIFSRVLYQLSYLGILLLALGQKATLILPDFLEIVGDLSHCFWNLPRRLFGDLENAVLRPARLAFNFARGIEFARTCPTYQFLKQAGESVTFQARALTHQAAD